MNSKQGKVKEIHTETHYNQTQKTKTENLESNEV